MEAASSSAAAAETVALIPCPDLAGGGMQFDDHLDDLENTQVTEPGRKRCKEFYVAQEMLTRCAGEAVGRASDKASMEMVNITSRLMQDAADRDRRLAERPARDGTTDRFGDRSIRNPERQDVGLGNKDSK